MNGSKDEKNDEDFAFLRFIWLEEWENEKGEQCICSMREDDIGAYFCLSERDPNPGEVAVEIGFTNMMVCLQKREALISQWNNELGKNFTSWLSEKYYYTYIYYKFMAWRILQVKHLKEKEEMREKLARL